MRKPKLKITVNYRDGLYSYQICQKGISMADFGGFATDTEACEAAETRKRELLAEMAQKAPPAAPPAKEKKPRKARAPRREQEPESSLTMATKSLQDARAALGALTMAEMETYGNCSEKVAHHRETIANLIEAIGEIKQ